jgi:hypothetical protein
MASSADDKGDNFKIVAAITIGTPFSGYAYSSRTTFRMNPLKVLQKEQWYSDRKSKNIIKTATCLLLRKIMDFVAFGYDALEQYAHLKYQEKHKAYMLFRDFNLLLYHSQVRTFLNLAIRWHGWVVDLAIHWHEWVIDFTINWYGWVINLAIRWHGWVINLAMHWHWWVIDLAIHWHG